MNFWRLEDVSEYFKTLTEQVNTFQSSIIHCGRKIKRLIKVVSVAIARAFSCKFFFSSFSLRFSFFFNSSFRLPPSAFRLLSSAFRLLLSAFHPRRPPSTVRNTDRQGNLFSIGSGEWHSSPNWLLTESGLLPSKFTFSVDSFCITLKAVWLQNWAFPGHMLQKLWTIPPRVKKWCSS